MLCVSTNLVGLCSLRCSMLVGRGLHWKNGQGSEKIRDSCLFMCNSHIAEDAGGLQNPTAEAGCIQMKSWVPDCVDAIQVVEHHDIRKRAFEHFSPNRAFLSQNGQIPTKNGQTSKKRARAEIYVTKGSPGIVGSVEVGSFHAPPIQPLWALCSFPNYKLPTRKRLCLIWSPQSG